MTLTKTLAKTKERRENLTGYLLMAPWLIGFLLMFLVPMVISLYFSFTNYNLLNIPKWIGGKNYVRMITDPDFWQSLKVTSYYTVVLVPLRLAFALMIALILNSKRKFLGLYRAAYYIPSIVGGSIAVSIIWKEIFGNNGVAMALLAILGVNQKVSTLGNTQTAIWAIISLGVWQFGSSMLIFLAALKQIPATYYEAARIDGAGSFLMFRRITLPMLTPVIFFNLVLQMINGFKVFTEGYIITDGGPMNSTLFYVLNLYRRAFVYFDMGYSCALAWVLVLVIGILTAILFKSQDNWVYYEKK